MTGIDLILNYGLPKKQRAVLVKMETESLIAKVSQYGTRSWYIGGRQIRTPAVLGLMDRGLIQMESDALSDKQVFGLTLLGRKLLELIEVARES